MNKSRKQYIESCEVSYVEEVTLGGFKQKIAVEGKHKNLPVVINLHGGPGSPVPFSVGCRGLFPEWTNAAIMVYWDQLGCGCNNREIDDGFTVQSFVDMTCELIAEMKKKFPENGIYLLGISWGSILALKAALKAPELLDGVFVYGQFLKCNFFTEEVASAFSSAPKKVKREVEEIVNTGGDCEYAVLDKNLKKLSGYLRKYTNAYINKNAPSMDVFAVMKGLISSPDYKFKDFKAVAVNGYRKNHSLWKELVHIDFAPDLKDVKIPYVLFQGDTDIVTSTETAIKAVKECGNENVKINVINNSGHMPSEQGLEDMFGEIEKIIKC